MRRALWPTAVGATTALVLSGCSQVPPEFKQAEAIECPSGSDCYDPPKPVGPGGVVEAEAGEFFFRVKRAAAQEGAVTVILTNVGGAQHDFTIDEAYGDNDHVPPDLVKPDETVEGVLELFAGSYTFYCSVPGHRQQGMEGTLSVAAAGPAAQATPAATANPSGPASPTEPAGEEGAVSPAEASPETTTTTP